MTRSLTPRRIVHDEVSHDEVSDTSKGSSIGPDFQGNRLRLVFQGLLTVNPVLTMMPVVQQSSQAAVEVLNAAETAAAVLDPARLRILAALRDPDSSAGVARSLGLPRQRVGHHVRALEAAGLLTFVGERKKRNCVERLLSLIHI